MIPFEALDSNQIKSAIEPDNLQRLMQLDIFNTIDSTNSYLLTRTKLGAPSGMVCLAEEQTQGRGRRGRKWFSTPGGNICCSVLWRFSDLENISGLSIAVAVMVANALKKYGVMAGIQLKWPNDILYAGRKLAGILLERNDHSGIVIGIGLNLHLPETESTWTSIHEITGNTVKRNYLTGLLVNELLAQLPMYQSRGLAGFINEWREYDMLINQMITVQLPEKTLSGVMKGINDHGELLLLTQAGELQRFCYGEVSCRLEVNGK